MNRSAQSPRVHPAQRTAHYERSACYRARSNTSMNSSSVRTMGFALVLDAAFVRVTMVSKSSRRKPYAPNPGMPRLLTISCRNEIAASAFVSAPVGQQPRQLRVACQGRVGGCAPAQRLQVDRRDVRQERCAHRSMRCGEHPADHAREAMHRAQPRVAQRHAAQQTGERHLFTRRRVRPLAIGDLERPGHARGCRPGRARPSAGSRATETNGSISCVNASRPVLAVTPGGIV